MYRQAVAIPGLQFTAWLAGHTLPLWLPLAAIFLATHAVIFYLVTGSWMAAALAAGSALTIRQSLGGEFWGVDGPSSVATRTIVAAVAPLALLLPGYWPLLILIHPHTVWRLITPQDNSGDPALAKRALDARFGYLFYPLGFRAIASVLVHMSLPLVVWVAVGMPLAWFAAAAAAYALGGTALIQWRGHVTNRPYLDIQTLRAFRFVLLPLYIGLAQGYAVLSPQATLILFGLSLIPPSWIVRVGAHGCGIPWLGWSREPDAAKRWAFKAGALAYLQGTGPLVRWHQAYEAQPAVRRNPWMDVGRRRPTRYAESYGRD